MSVQDVLPYIYCVMIGAFIVVYNELKLVWQTVKRARTRKDATPHIEFLEFLALEGDCKRVRQTAMRYYLELRAPSASTPMSLGTAAKD